MNERSVPIHKPGLRRLRMSDFAPASSCHSETQLSHPWPSQTEGFEYGKCEVLPFFRQKNGTVEGKETLKTQYRSQAELTGRSVVQVARVTPRGSTFT